MGSTSRPATSILPGLLCAYICLYPIPNSRGQDLFELGVLLKREEPVVCVSPFGVETRRRMILQVNDPFGQLSFATRGVQKELELTADQLDKFRQLEKQNKEFIQSQFEDLISSQTDVVGYSRRFEQQRAELKDEFSKILSPRQLERMNQLENRLIVRRFGLGFFLETQEASHEITLSPSDRNAISDKAKELLAEVQETKTKFHADVLECVLNELDEPQLKALRIDDKQEFIDKNTESAGDAALDLLITQARDSKWKTTKSPELPNSFPLVRTQVYVADANGDLVRFTPGFHSSVCDGERVAGYGQMLGLILKESSRDALELTNEQISELIECEDYLVEKLVELDLYLFGAANPWNANENGIDIQIGLGRELDQRINEILIPEQTAKLRAISHESVSIGSGWLAALNDELRTHNYPLSANQAARLETRLKAQSVEIAKRISDLAVKTSRALTAQISNDELRSQLEKHLGGDDEIVGGNFVFLIADLRALANWKN